LDPILEDIFLTWETEGKIKDTQILGKISIPQILEATGSNFLYAIQIANGIIKGSEKGDIDKIIQLTLRPVIKW